MQTPLHTPCQQMDIYHQGHRIAFLQQGQSLHLYMKILSMDRADSCMAVSSADLIVYALYDSWKSTFGHVKNGAFDGQKYGQALVASIIFPQFHKR